MATGDATSTGTQTQNEYMRFIASCRERGIEQRDYDNKRSDLLSVYLNYIIQYFRDISAFCTHIDDIVAFLGSDDRRSLVDPMFRNCEIEELMAPMRVMPFIMNWVKGMSKQWIIKKDALHDRYITYQYAIRYLKNLNSFVETCDDALFGSLSRNIVKKKVNTFAPSAAMCEMLIECLHECVAPVKQDGSPSIPIEQYMADVLIAETRAHRHQRR